MQTSYVEATKLPPSVRAACICFKNYNYNEKKQKGFYKTDIDVQQCRRTANRIYDVVAYFGSFRSTWSAATTVEKVKECYLSPAYGQHL